MATLEIDSHSHQATGATKRQAASAARAALEFVGLAAMLAVLAVGFLVALNPAA